MPLHIVKNDLANMRVQAIVCPSNSGLYIGGGAGGRIAEIAGIEKVQAACDAIGGCETGKAVVTPAFGFPADMLVHAVGPIWDGGDSSEVELLRSCVKEALAMAFENGAETIAIPLISSGIFGFPAEIAVEVETSAILEFLNNHDMEIWLVLYDNDAIRAGRRLFDDIEEYIDDVYVEELTYGIASDDALFLEDCLKTDGFAPSLKIASASMSCLDTVFEDEDSDSLEDRLEMLDESFARTVLRLIDERGMTDVEVYKRANMSKQLFAKIRKDDNYRPTKRTACALVFALKLNYEDATALLKRAGFALSHSSKFDIIIEYFLLKGNHDIFQVNEALFAFDQQLLG